MPATIDTHSPMTFLDASWGFYECLREEMSDGTRIAYYRGKLEVMSPISIGHEGDKSLLARLIIAYCERQRLLIDGMGSLTLSSGAVRVALEPDDAFYLTTPPPPRDAGVIDLSIHAPPDLAIEIEHSRGSIDKDLIYRELRVPEVWRWDGMNLRIRRLRDDRTGYDDAATSACLPGLPVDELVEHLRRAADQRQSEIVRSWIERIA